MGSGSGRIALLLHRFIGCTTALTLLRDNRAYPVHNSVSWPLGGPTL